MKTLYFWLHSALNYAMKASKKFLQDEILHKAVSRKPSAVSQTTADQHHSDIIFTVFEASALTARHFLQVAACPPGNIS